MNNWNSRVLIREGKRPFKICITHRGAQMFNNRYFGLNSEIDIDFYRIDIIQFSDSSRWVCCSYPQSAKLNYGRIKSNMMY